MYRKVVVPLDTSPLSEQAAARAAAIAKRTQGTVHVVHAYEPSLSAFEGGATVDEQVLAIEKRQFERHMQRVADNLVREFGCKVKVAVLGGVPSEAIAKYARQEGADVVVMSTHGRTGANRAWFGSVSDQLAHRLPIPVLMVRPHDGEAPKQLTRDSVAFERIVIALDGSAASEAAISCVRALRPSETTAIVLVEVVSPVPLPVIDVLEGAIVTAMAPDLEATEKLAALAGKHLDSLGRRLARETGAKVETEVIIAASAGPAIVDYAKSFRADLVALSSHGRGVSRLLIGSVADKILRGTHCSILLRRDSPVKAARKRVADKKRSSVATRES